MRDRLRLLWTIPLLLLALGLAACDAQVNVNPEIDFGDPAVEGRVEQLEADLLAQRERAASLEAEVARLQEESVVIHGADGLTLRLNTPAAAVLVVAILGATLCFVARMKYRAEPDS